MMVHSHFVTKRSFVFVMIGIRLAGLVFNIFNMVDFADKSEELKFYRNLMIVKKNQTTIITFCTLLVYFDLIFIKTKLVS